MKRVSLFARVSHDWSHGYCAMKNKSLTAFTYSFKINEIWKSIKAEVTAAMPLQRARNAEIGNDYSSLIWYLCTGQDFFIICLSDGAFYYLFTSRGFYRFCPGRGFFISDREWKKCQPSTGSKAAFTAEDCPETAFASAMRCPSDKLFWLWKKYSMF